MGPARGPEPDLARISDGVATTLRYCLSFLTISVLCDKRLRYAHASLDYGPLLLHFRFDFFNCNPVDLTYI